MLFRQITDTKLAQYAYLIGCQQTGEAVIIDPERDIDRYIELAATEKLEITAVAETHIHADYVSGARAFAEAGVPVYVSDEGDADWKYEWAKNREYDVRLLKHGDEFSIGNIQLKAIHTPGHTPEHLSFLVTDYGGGATDPIGIATGDFVFVGDLGRPDLLESAAQIDGQMVPSARTLFGSLERFTDLPDYIQVWPGHGAGSACGKALGAVPQSTVGYERRFNTALDIARRGEDAFIDAILAGQPEPPLYFARMKRLNKVGPPLLDGLPRPERVDAERLAAVLAERTPTPIDARLERSSFMERHLPGSIFAPFNKAFNTSVGSVADPDDTFLLVIDEDDVEEAVRDLIRVGYDDIAYYVTPGELDRFVAQGGTTASIPHIDMEGLDAHRNGRSGLVLDVRYASEYESAHLPEAIHIPYTRLADRLDEVPRGRPVTILCATGARSAVAASLMAGKGYDVTYVGGDFDEYLAAGGGAVRSQADARS